MTEYLTAEQRAELERQLSGGMLTEEQADGAVREGMRMAQADMERQGAGLEDSMAQEEPLVKEYGFESVQQMAEAYEKMQAAVSELRGMLKKLLDMDQAERAAAQLDAAHPEYGVRRQIEEDLRPMREEMRTAARNRLIQRDWQDSAADMYDLELLLPEIAEYILRNPRYAGESDGLRRAYDAVRSGKYRAEDELLSDPGFIERMAGNELVKEAVLRAHLEEIRKGGRIPQAVGAGQESGKTPLTGRKPITGMEMAKKRLEAMLK